MSTFCKRIFKNRLSRCLLLIILVISLILNFIFIVANYKSNTVTAVIDGDTLDLADGRRVRLLAIDAPEKGRCLSEEAGEKLRSLVLGRHVRLKEITKDDYGRIIAIVIVEDFHIWLSYMRYWIGERTNFYHITLNPDPLVNRVMVRDGLAKYLSTTGQYKNTLTKAHEYAKAQGLGIYSMQCRSTIARDECNIKGNIREGKNVYYIPSCKYYNQVIVDEAFGDEWLRSEEEAKEKEFTLSATCD